MTMSFRNPNDVRSPARLGSSRLAHAHRLTRVVVQCLFFSYSKGVAAGRGPPHNCWLKHT